MGMGLIRLGGIVLSIRKLFTSRTWELELIERSGNADPTHAKLVVGAGLEA
jgi:hypothetical protein